MAQPRTQDTPQYMENDSYDPIFKVLTRLNVESDGTNLRRAQTPLMASKVTTSGNYTYVAKAPIGTAQATAGWQVKRIEVSGNDTITTYADGDAAFDNVATDLTSLTYS